MLSLSKIVIQFLLWKPRIQNDYVGALNLKRISGLKASFIDYLSRRNPMENKDDIQNSVGHFFSEYDSFLKWNVSLLELEGIRIAFFKGQPRVEQNGLEAWRAITAYIDSDSLIMLDLVAKGQRKTPNLNQWGTIAPSADWDLEKIIKKGIADTHIHLGGADPTPLLWQRIMHGEVDLERLARYAYSRQIRKKSADPDEYQDLLDEKKIIEKARDELRPGLLVAIRENQAPVLSETSPSGKPELIVERQMLFHCWKAVFNRDPVIAKHLDLYLYAKNLFLQHHQQHPETNPGLVRFREYFDRSKVKSASKSKRIQKEKIERSLKFVLESPDLKYISIRISPYDDIGGYIDFFNLWHKNIQNGDWLGEKEKEDNVKIRFIIHFIRSPEKRNNPDERIPYESLRRTVERQSAILHFFRRNYPTLAKYISGVDVANLERDCPPDIFTPYINLLRGESVSFLNDNKLLCPTWMRLKERDEILHPVDLPRLGLTYHAGEDFYHPVDGMRNMDSVIQGAKMTPGDRIGHGLAAGWDVEKFSREAGRSLLLPQGDFLDNLVWLYNYKNGAFMELSEKLRSEIHDLAIDIYGRDATPDELFRLQSQRHRIPPLERGVYPKSPEILLWEEELFCNRCRSKRKRLTTLSDKFGSCLPLIQYAQEAFVKKMTEMRIVVEFNPSSNLATGNIRSLASHPYFTYLNILNKAPLVSFNTDDPGVFHTRIELEYALMMEAMKANKVDGNRIVELLDRARQVGVDSVF